MTTSHRHAAWALVTYLAAGVPAGGQDHSKECPMHAAHVAETARRQDVDARHDAATGVSHAVSVHHFTLYPDGGRILLETVAGRDEAARDRIREHLTRIAREFGTGQFDMPRRIHDRLPPGVETLQRLKSAVRYEYSATPGGGQVRITTTNREARDAVHAFLRFQIEDHGTGDSVQVTPRP
jgi:hypothetical protein